jgi:regulator of cell morphogenesis and NO signaling
MEDKKQDYANVTIAEIVTDDISKAGVFKKFGLDFCCGGGRTIQDACAKKGVDVNALISELEKPTKEKGTKNLNFNDWPLHLLVDYIIEVHHNYVRENLPVIVEFAEKVARVHGHADEELHDIKGLVDDMAMDLNLHMQKEEMVLFPFVKNISGKTKLEEGEANMVINGPIRMMEIEHDNVGEIIKKLRTLSHDFTPPGHACNTYKALYFKLEEFEDDLFNHIHLENNILFKKVKAMAG